MPEQAHTIDEREAPARLEKTAALFGQVRARLGEVIFGQDAVMETVRSIASRRPADPVQALLQPFFSRIARPLRDDLTLIWINRR